jgi:uncharacterized membrane protein
LVASNRQLAADADDQDRLMALLAYLIGIIMPLVILLSDMKNRPFRRFHAVNSLGLSVAYLVVIFIVCICGIILQIAGGNVPGVGLVGSLVFSCLFPLVGLAYLALLIWYMVLAYQGNYFDIPVITNFCRRQGWL